MTALRRALKSRPDLAGDARDDCEFDSLRGHAFDELVST